jgi:MFS family permease
MYRFPIQSRLGIDVSPSQIALVVAGGALLTMILELRATSFWTYALSRITFGLTRAAMPVANGVLCDIFSSADERSQAISKNGAAVGVGFLIGAATGGALVGCVSHWYFSR